MSHETNLEHYIHLCHRIWLLIHVFFLPHKLSILCFKVVPRLLEAIVWTTISISIEKLSTSNQEGQEKRHLQLIYSEILLNTHLLPLTKKFRCFFEQATAPTAPIWPIPTPTHLRVSDSHSLTCMSPHIDKWINALYYIELRAFITQLAAAHKKL